MGVVRSAAAKADHSYRSVCRVVKGSVGVWERVLAVVILGSAGVQTHSVDERWR